MGILRKQEKEEEIEIKKFQRRLNVVGNQASGKSRATLAIATYFGEKLSWDEVKNLGGTVNPITYRLKTKLPESEKDSLTQPKKNEAPSYISLYNNDSQKNWPEYSINLTDHPGQQVYNNLRKLVAIRQRNADLKEILNQNEEKKINTAIKSDAEGFICFLDGIAWNFKDIAFAHAIELLESIPARVKKVPIAFIINKFDIVKSLRQKNENNKVLDFLATHLSNRIIQMVNNNPAILQYTSHSIPGYPSLQIHAQLFVNEELRVITVPFSHLEQFIRNEIYEYLPTFMITGEWSYTVTAQMARAITLSLMEISREVGLVESSWDSMNLVSELNMRRATTLESGIRSECLMGVKFGSKKPYGEPYYEREDISVASQFQIPLAQIDGYPLIKPDYMKVVLDSVVASPSKVERYINHIVEAINSGKYKQIERFEFQGYTLTDSVSNEGIQNQINLVTKMLRFNPIVDEVTSEDLAMEKLSLDMF